MTCIVGLVDNDRVLIGGDSAGVDGLDIKARADQKVFQNNEYLFGFTTSFRMGQLLRWKLDPPEAPTENLEQFMVTTFIDSIRECLSEGGRESGGTFLVGVRDRLFAIYNDYQVGETVSGYQAVGCGSEYALGAIHALQSSLFMMPEARVQKALKAAQMHSTGVCGPFHILSTNG